jgi:hypothetical protein
MRPHANDLSRFRSARSLPISRRFSKGKPNLHPGCGMAREFFTVGDNSQSVAYRAQHSYEIQTALGLDCMVADSNKVAHMAVVDKELDATTKRVMRA